MNNLELNQSLQMIGFRISGKLSESKDIVDIEKTLFEVSLQVSLDGRIFALLCSWVLVHGDKVIIEKLMKMQKQELSPWIVALAVFAYHHGFHQWKRLIKPLKNKIFFVSFESAQSQIARKGAFPGMAEQNIFIANNEIRLRTEDILSQKELIQSNRQYRNRYLYGACIRSDVISLIEVGVPNPYQIAKKLGCSQGPAYRIMKEYRLAMAS